VPPKADVSAVADAIVKLVDTPFGKRSFQVHIGSTQDGAEVVNAVSDRVRAELPLKSQANYRREICACDLHRRERAAHSP
jgi:hypothetical protein